MTGSSRGIGLILGFVVLVLSGAAGAQENLDKGKTPAQLYAADCAICHKTMRGMSRVGGIFGLESFLRVHYTASRESAAAIAAYIRKNDKGPLPPAHTRTARPRHHHAPAKSASDKSVKPVEPKTVGNKTVGDKPNELKSTDKKSAKAKGTEAEAKALKPKTGKPAKGKDTKSD